MSKREKLCIAWFFAFEGVISGSFSGSADLFKENNQWGEESFGWIIFACVGAGIAAVPIVAKLCDAHGSKNLTLVSAGGLLVSTPFMAKFTATDGVMSYLCLVAFVLIFGVLMAALDICVNAQACLYEKLTGESHMGFMHALYAVGAVVGSLLAGLLIRLGYSFFQILCIIVAFCGVVSPCFLKIIPKEEEQRLNETAQASSLKGDIEFDKLNAAALKILRPLTDTSVPMKTFSSATDPGTVDDVELSLGNVGSSSKYEFLLEDEDEEEDEEEEIIFNPIERSGSGREHSSGSTNTSVSSDKGYTLLVALTLTLCIAFLVEGSIGDWSAIYLAEECRVPKSSGLDAMGYAVFNVFVVLSRLLSDRAEGKVSRSSLLKACSVCSLGGFWLTALAPRFLPAEVRGAEEGDYSGALAVASLGFACTGIALGPVSAIVMAAAGQIKGIDPTAAVSTVSGLSYVGLLAGPILLGLVAQYLSLAAAFFLSGLLIVTIYPLAALL